MTITGQSWAKSRFAGTAIATSACSTGDNCPRPANERRSGGSSTLNSAMPPGFRPGAAQVTEVKKSKGSSTKDRFTNARASSSVGVGGAGSAAAGGAEEYYRRSGFGKAGDDTA